MSQYYNIKTNAGDAAIATALANNTKLNITHVAFGDGGGSVPTPSKNRTTLVHEVHRQAVNKYTQHPTITKWLTVEAIIPSNIGGFWIREIGVIADNVLISHGSHAPFFKVADTDGVSEYRLKFTIDIQDASIVQLTLDESLIYASQAWVNENYVPRADIVNNLTTADATKPLSAAQGKVLQDNKLGKTENAVSATKLQTARTIGGVAFDGTTKIDLPGVNTAGNQNTSGNAATATKLQTARTIGGVSFDGSANINLPGVNTAGNQNTSGNAATATKLQTARTIGGVAFDGTTNIDLPGVNTAGNQNTSGNAATATKLQTARKINGVNFDGTADILVPDNWQYIPYGADLNNYITAGYYFCDQDTVGASVWNSPIAFSFSLIVEQTAGVVQRITGYFGANIIEYKRAYYSGGWSGWKEVLSDERIRDYNVKRYLELPTAKTLTAPDFNNIRENGLYFITTIIDAQNKPPVDSWGYLKVINESRDNLSRCLQEYIPDNYTEIKYVRGLIDAGWTTWVEYKNVPSYALDTRTNQQTGISTPNGVGIYATEDGNVFLFGGTQAHTPRWNIEYGGTGARNATDARENLGLGKVENTYDREKDVLSAIKLTGIDQRLIKPYETPVHAISSYFTSESGLNSSYANAAYGDILVLNSYRDKSGGYINGLFFHKTVKRIYHYQAELDSAAWGTPSEIAYTTDNVASATKLQTARTISISGAVQGSAVFDGSGNIDIAAVLNNFGGLKGSNGYKYLGDGTLIQWVRLNKIVGQYSGEYNFPIAFPNVCFGVSISNSWYVSKSGNGYQLRAGVKSNTVFGIGEDNFNGQGVGNMSQAFVIAIGC